MAPLNPRGDTNLLHPVARPVFQKLTRRLAEAHANQETTTWFRPFETYRTPHRQQELYDSRANGRIVTKARAWESAHQFGLAVDFVALEKPPRSSQNAERQWSWDSSYDWGFIRKIVQNEFDDWLICDIDWDPGHVEHKLWLDYRTIHQWWRDHS